MLDSLLDSPLREAFAAGGGFNAGKHPKGAHGYFITTGSQGTDVKRAQHRLGVNATGAFDGATRQAVVRFQRQHGLAVDGVIGAQTIAALNGQANAASVKPAALTPKQLEQFRRATSRNASARTSAGGRSSRGGKSSRGRGKSGASAQRAGGGVVIG